MTTEAAVRKLLEFRALPEGWDSYGAECVGGAAAQAAMDLIDTMDDVGDLYHICPTPDGGITLEWQAHGACAEIDVDESGGYSYLFTMDDFEEERRTCESKDQVVDDVRRFFLATDGKCP